MKIDYIRQCLLIQMLTNSYVPKNMDIRFIYMIIYFCHMNNNRKKILGVPVDAYQPHEFIVKIKKGLQDNRLKTIFAVNAEKIMFARKDSEIYRILNESNFLIPDGFGPVVGLNLSYGKKIARTTGIGLMQGLLCLAEKEKEKVFIFGSKPEVVKSAEKNIIKRYPLLDLVGTQHGYVSTEDYKELIERINTLKTDILFVGLGSPKQEKWIYKHKGLLKVKICMGIGGSLDVIAGKAQLAPAWISNFYLEWIYRLIKNPSRIKRQIKIPVFIAEMLIESLFVRLKNTDLLT